jgi:hypothetical protein
MLANLDEVDGGVHAGTAQERRGDGPLKVVQARPVLLPGLAPVVNDQVHDLLLSQAGLGPKIRERQIVSRLALVPQVVTLPQPGVLERMFTPSRHALPGAK